MNIDIFHMTIIVNWTQSAGAFLNFSIFYQDIRALPGADRGTEPFGEIRGCIHEQLSHSDVGPKMTYKSKNCEKLLQ